MKILYFGDVFGKPGRKALSKALEKLVPLHEPDFIIVNGENAAHGRGITPEIATQFHDWGVDVVTTGNHAWDQKVIIPFMDRETWIIRPINYPSSSEYRCPGKGMTEVTSNRNGERKRLVVIQAIGRVFMEDSDCPFRAVEDQVLQLRRQGVKHVFVDFHAEASSEKQAFMSFLDGRVSAVVGSHAHVQTADERVLPYGTAAITDVGMTGCFDSVIGVKKEISIAKFLTKRHQKFEPADGPGGYGAVLITLHPETGKALSIKRFRETVI